MSVSRRVAFLADAPVYDKVLTEANLFEHPWENWINNVLEVTNEINTVFVEVDTSAAAQTVTLTTQELREIKNIVIKDVSGNAAVNNITVNTENSETIDGALSQLINTNYGALHIFSNGTNWFIY